MSTTTPAEYLRSARAIEARWAEAGETPRRLGVLASFTADFLRPFLVVEADRIGLPLRPTFAPFGQLEQIALDPTSAIYTEESRADVVWLALRLEDADPRLVEELPELPAAERAARVAAARERLVALVRGIRQRSTAVILASSFAPPPTLDAFDANDPDGLGHVVHAESRALARDLAAIPGAHVFDWAGLVARVGADRFGDPKLWYMARSPIAASSQPALASALARSIRATLAPAAKCIVVDLDNTLWGGVIGDDGPEGIKLGDDHPGSVFKDFQRALLELRRRGFLLAIASKNDASTVDEVLRSHPEMVLRASDFAAIHASWEPKPLSLRKIAEDLNIGLDSLVFLDDNPVERAQVRAELPAVLVPELPVDPMGYVGALRGLAAIDRPRLLAEDRSRASMYVAEATRRELSKAAPDVGTFLRGLEMTATIGLASPLTLERIHQLIHKTNQFNLTTRRHGIDELDRLARSPESAVAWLRLADRFGDMGLVCVGIVRRAEGDLFEIDTFLMSCRVMGRSVEDAFLSYLLDLAVERGARRVRGVYRRTPKSSPVVGFYAGHGFRELESTAEGAVYERDPVNDPHPWPEAIARRVETTEVPA